MLALECGTVSDEDVKVVGGRYQGLGGSAELEGSDWPLVLGESS